MEHNKTEHNKIRKIVWLIVYNKQNKIIKLFYAKLLLDIISLMKYG
jgi:hypothetical protein